MKVIGITGPTGAGKTTALNALRSLGGQIIDADAVYHDLTRSSPALRAELEARFGPVYNGETLDRKKLGAVVFQDQKALADLNAITHKYVAQETARRIASARQREFPRWALTPSPCWRALWRPTVTVPWPSPRPEELRVKRIMAREGISEDYARMRVAAQKPSAWFQAHCDDTLESTETDTVETFAQRARALFQQMLEESK